jgi:nucleoid-associated protein YgaU
MQKDLKIGLFVGLVLTISALLWLATRPSLSPIARMSHVPNPEPLEESPVSPNDLTAANVNIDENQPPANNPQPELPDSTKYEQAVKIKPQKFHIVLKNQTLSSISQKYYGSAGNWKKIFDYNQNIIKDPNKLIPGTKLIIPD